MPLRYTRIQPQIVNNMDDILEYQTDDKNINQEVIVKNAPPKSQMLNAETLKMKLKEMNKTEQKKTEEEKK